MEISPERELAMVWEGEGDTIPPACTLLVWLIVDCLLSVTDHTPNHLHPLTYFSPCSSTSSLSYLCSSNPPPHSHKFMLCKDKRDTERTQDVSLKTRPTLLFPSYVDSPCLSPHSWSPQCWSSCLGPPVMARTFHHTRHSAETCGWGRGGSIGTCLWLAVGVQEFLWHFLWCYYKEFATSPVIQACLLFYFFIYFFDISTLFFIPY